MWVLLGIIAFIATFSNLYLYGRGRDYQLAMAMGLSFTALTLVAQYSMVADWVKIEDWSALIDVVPTLEVALWILTAVAIFLNIAPILLEWNSRRKV